MFGGQGPAGGVGEESAPGTFLKSWARVAAKVEELESEWVREPGASEEVVEVVTGVGEAESSEGVEAKEPGSEGSVSIGAEDGEDFCGGARSSSSEGGPFRT